MTVALSSPITTGFMRPFTLTPDEPVGAATVTQDVGDSTLVIDPTSTSTLITGFVRGDGSVGTGKQATISVAQLTAGDPPVAITITWDVHGPDATTLAFKEAGPDVTIPASGKK